MKGEVHRIVGTGMDICPGNYYVVSEPTLAGFSEQALRVFLALIFLGHERL